MNNSDRVIIQQVLDGDKSAYDVLVERYKNRLYALILAKTGDIHAVEDIVQQAFIDAYSDLKTLKDPDKFSFWLSRIASNQCYRWQKKSYRQARSKESYQSELQTDSINNQTPESLYIDHERRMQVLEAVEELKPEHREVVVLRYMEDMTYQEIASFLDIPMSTVVGRFRLAKDYLESALTLARFRICSSRQMTSTGRPRLWPLAR